MQDLPPPAVLCHHFPYHSSIVHYPHSVYERRKQNAVELQTLLGCSGCTFSYSEFM